MTPKFGGLACGLALAIAAQAGSSIAGATAHTAAASCQDDTECISDPGGPYCVDNSCHECRLDNQGCDPNGASPHCSVESLTCGPCVVTDPSGSSTDCASSSSGPFCVADQFYSDFGRCVACLVNSQCQQPPEGSFVSPTCLRYSGHVCGPCYLAEFGDLECQNDIPSRNACAPVGGVFSGACVECTTDQHCDGSIGPPSSSGNFCDASKQTCGACGSGASCDPNSATPICDSTGIHNRCVPCDPFSFPCPNGLQCNLETGACVECLDSIQCGGSEPICDSSYHCRGCTFDNECTDIYHPACQPNGACGQCSLTNQFQCSADTFCELESGSCRPVPIQADGFESGDFSAWSWPQP